MKSDCVLLGCFFAAIGAILAFFSTIPHDPACYMIGGAVGAIFILCGVVLIVEGCLEGGLEE